MGAIPTPATTDKEIISMGVSKEIWFEVSGQINDDCAESRLFDIIEAELRLVCAKYNLKLEDRT